jgi:hypothetical protein
MKVNKLSKSKINKNKSKRNNKTKNKNQTKNKTKTKKRINHLKGGNNENNTRLLNFINSLPINDNNIKILTYFDIKIILLYIVAYELVDISMMRQIFKWLNYNNNSNNSNNNNSPLHIMMLFNSSLNNLSPLIKGNKLSDDHNLYNGIILLNKIYKIINRVINFTTITTPQMLFTFKYIMNTINYNEYTEFFNYLSNLNFIKSPEKLTKNDSTRIINIHTNIVQISDNSPKVIQLKHLLGEINYNHFIGNYPKIFEIKGNMVNFIQFQNLNATTPQRKINSPNITKCSNYITKTPLKVNTTTPIYNCFLKNCKLLINYVNNVDNVDNVLNGVLGNVSGGITLNPFVNRSSNEIYDAEQKIISTEYYKSGNHITPNLPSRMPNKNKK